MMFLKKVFMGIALLSILTIGVSGCVKKESTEDQIEDAMEEAGDEIEEAGDAVEDATD